jgi:hypothetical protein
MIIEHNKQLAPHQSNRSRMVGFVISVLICYFIFRLFRQDITQLYQYQFQFNFFFLACFFVVAIVSVVLNAYSWKKIVDYIFGRNIFSFLEAIVLFFYTNIGKYIPGRVWGVVGVVYLLPAPISKPTVVASFFFHAAASILVGGGWGVLLSAFVFTDFAFLFVSIAIVLFGAAFIFFTKFSFFQKPLQVILKKIGRVMPDYTFHNFTWRQAGTIMLIISVFELTAGMSFFLLAQSVMALPMAMGPALVGFFLLASILSFIFFIVPAGLGIQEGSLVGLLIYLVPASIAILLVVVLRVGILLIDVALFFFAHMCNKKLKILNTRR